VVKIFKSLLQKCSLSFSLQLGEQLKQLVPQCGLTVIDLEVDGTCVRFSPLMTAEGKAINCSSAPQGSITPADGQQPDECVHLTVILLSWSLQRLSLKELFFFWFLKRWFLYLIVLAVLKLCRPGSLLSPGTKDVCNHFWLKKLFFKAKFKF
jgi:hypothetical protein